MKWTPILTILLLCFSFWMTSCTSPKETNVAVKPNVLFAIMDDATWEHMGAYGCSWVKTPSFDYVAENGILFNRAYTPNAKCAPSRSCILTGRNSWQLEEAANHVPFFPTKFKTFPEVLEENGYHVGHTAKGWAPGIVRDIDGEKRNLIGQAYNDAKTNPPTTEISKIDYSANFKYFLTEAEESQPFFFWFGSYEPHRRYEFGSGVKKAGKDITDIDKVYDFWPDNTMVRNDMLDYALEIEYFDKQLGQMIDELRETGQLENTMIVVTSDNGMPFPRIKGQEFELSNHLPLAIMWPNGIEHPGRVVNDLVSFIDFAPTFLELSEVGISGMASITGTSLMTILQSEKSNIVEASRNRVLIGKERHDVGRPNDGGYPIRGIIQGNYLFIVNFEPDRWPAGDPETGFLNCDGSPTKSQCLQAKMSEDTYKYWLWNFGKRVSQELYHIKKDPECMTNLALDDKNQELISTLRTQLMAELKEQGDPRVLGEGKIFDRYTYAHEETRDFYNRFMAGESMKTGWVNSTDFEKSK